MLNIKNMRLVEIRDWRLNKRIRDYGVWDM